MSMIRMNPQIISDLYGKDVVAFGTGEIGRRIIPYLAQDPNIKLHGVTNSRVTVDDDGTFLETGLPIRSLHAWAERLPHATILVTSQRDLDAVFAVCKAAGFHEFRLVDTKILTAFKKAEGQLAEAYAPRFFEHLCLANELRDAHKAAFSEFKACNRGGGGGVAVVGTGPSLSYYTQLPGVSHIGVNASFLKEDLTLEYYFTVHYVREWAEKLKEYDFIKFFDINRKFNSADQFPEHVIEENNGRRFFSMSYVPGTQVHTDIAYYPLMGYGSIIFRAIHFALYTRPKTLFLVGCDCAANGHFDETSDQLAHLTDIYVSEWLEGFRNVKKFASLHYPDTEIVSVNPVGLKGWFRDVYTESYLDAHPEIDKTGCELLRSENWP